MNDFLKNIGSYAVVICEKTVAALAVFIIGRLLIKFVGKLLHRSKLLNKVEGSVKSFTLSFVKIGLYVILAISIVSILGVPMASVIAVLASAAAAIGLALQGSLSNLAGGLMIITFKPFKSGDYVDAAGASGTVDSVNLFYTTFLTPDNKRVSVPNGNLMNSNVINYSSENIRRVDMVFLCARGEDPSKVQQIMLETIASAQKILADPKPMARLSDNTSEAMSFAVRVWCENADYWDVYYDLTQSITEALAKNGIKSPSIRLTSVEEK